MKSMKLSRYFEIVNPKYTTLQITPHSSIRNYNSSNIAKMVTIMYRSMSKSIHKEEKKYFIETKVKCTYAIDIYKTDIKFYFIVPQEYVLLAKEKISSVWDKATVEECVYIPKFTHEHIHKYQLNYTKLDAFSLAVDKKSNNPLNSILNVVDIMQDEDRILIAYNFIPCSQYGWKTKCDKAHEKFKNNIPITKEITGWKVGITILFAVADFLDRVFTIEKKSENIFSDLSKALRDNDKKISEQTKAKKHDTVLDTQIMVIGTGTNSDRTKNQCLTVCNAYTDIEEDNSLDFEKVLTKEPIDLYSYRYDGVRTNKISTNECQNFLQLPARELLQKHRINHVNVTETVVPEPLQRGYIWAGKHTHKGHTIDTYLSSEKNINNLPLIPMGKMGAGKTTLLGGVANNVIKNTKEGVIVIDYIKKCELSDYIKAHTPKDRLIEIDLSIPEQRQALAFNERDISKCTTIEEIVDEASMLTQETVRLIDSINTEGEPLKPKMRRYLTSACNVVFTQPNQSLKDVIKCLEDEEYRKECIDRLSDGLKQSLEEEIYNLRALDEKKKDEVVGTKDGKIEGVIDRVNLLKEDSKLKSMFNKSPKNNVNFVDAMNQGKVVLIRMPQAKFSRHHRNILTTFFISKIWLACELRGDTQDTPLRNHLIVDEVFDAPTSFNVLTDMLVQVRKFQLKLIFSVHYLSQIEPIREALKASGASYMLLQGTDKKNYEELKSELQPYTVEDLLNLKQYNSLNLMTYSKGYATYISDLTVKI